MKRTLCILLSLCLCLMVFAACGSSDTSSDTSASAAESEASEAEEEEEAAPEEPEEEMITNAAGASYNSEGYVLPLFEEPVTITYRASLNETDLETVDGDYANNHAVQAAEEATGVHVEWVTPSTTTEIESLQLAIAAGDYEDIIGNFSGLYSGTMVSAIENEVIVDLIPYLDDYMPFYKEAIQASSDDTKRSLYGDGYLCGVDTISDYLDITGGGTMIRMDYLDAVGMDVPVTYDDLHEVLTAFKDQLGIAQPLMLPKDICPMSNSLCSGFDVNGNFATEPFMMAPWYQVDGEIKYGILEEGYHEFIEMIHQWYDEGLISQDFIEKNDNPAGATYIGVITGGDAGVFFGETDLMATYIVDGVAENPDYEIACLPEIVQEEGQITHFVNNQSQLAGDMSCVNAHSDQIGAVLTWLDYFYTPEGCLYGEMGVEGESYEVVDGKYQFTDTYLNADMTDKVKPVYFMQDEVPRKGVDTPDTYTLEIQLTAEDVWITNDDGAYVLPDIALTEEESETYARVYSDVSTYIAESLTKFVVGDKDLADWDAFIDEIYNIGMQDCLDIYQAALDRYYTIDISVFS